MRVFRKKESHPIKRTMLLCVIIVLTAMTFVLSVGASSSDYAYTSFPSASMPPLQYQLKKRTAGEVTAFQHNLIGSPSFAKRAQAKVSWQNNNAVLSVHARDHSNTALRNNVNNDDTSNTSSSSFLSTSRANVRFEGNSPSNLSPIDQLILTLTSDKTSLLLGSVGILLLLLLRLLSFPEDAMYEASRSRVDLLGTFAAGSVLLNGITKLDVESVQAERVALEGVNQDNVVWVWTEGRILSDAKFQSTAEWALSSFLKCSPARTAVLLATNPKENQRWVPLATLGILPLDPQLRSSIPDSVANKTPILDRMLREDDSIKGGTVGGTEVAGATPKKGPKESYLPTLQALPGRVEFTYLPSNAQEVLILPVTKSGERGKDGDGNDDDGWYYAVVLGGDTAKSFAPRDIAWCKEMASWIGELV